MAPMGVKAGDAGNVGMQGGMKWAWNRGEASIRNVRSKARWPCGLGSTELHKIAAGVEAMLGVVDQPDDAPQV